MDSPPSLYEFLQDLRLDSGLAVGPREHIALETLLSSPGWNPAELRAALASVLARSPEEWQRVAARFDEIYGYHERSLPSADASTTQRFAPGRSQSSERSAIDTRGLETHQVGPAPKIPLHKRLGQALRNTISRLWRAFVDLPRPVVFVGLALGMVLALLAVTSPLVGNLPDRPAGTTGDSRPPPEPPPQEVGLTLLQGPQWADDVPVTWMPKPEPWWAQVVVAAIALVLVALGLRLWLLPAAIAAARKREEAHCSRTSRAALVAAERELVRSGEPLRVEHYVDRHPAIGRQAILDSAENLGRIFRLERGRDLAPEPTVRKTVAAGGRFVPVTLPAKLRSEILVLVDVELGDHPWLGGFARVLDAWERQGVRLLRYDYGESPDSPLDPETRETPSLHTVARRTRGLPLILFSRRLDPEGYNEPARWLAELAAWPLKAWIDPDPRPLQERGEAREEQIGRLEACGLVRFPLTDTSIVSMARWFASEGTAPVSRDWGDLAPRAGQDAAVDEALRRWALVASLVPDPTWDQLEAFRRRFPEVGSVLTRRRDLQRLWEWVAEQTGNPHPEFQSGACLNIPEEVCDRWLRTERAAESGVDSFERRAHKELISELEGTQPGSRLIDARRFLKLSIHRAQLEPDKSWEHLAWALEADSLVRAEAKGWLESELARQAESLGEGFGRSAREGFARRLGNSAGIDLRELFVGGRELWRPALKGLAVAAVILSIAIWGLSHSQVRSQFQVELVATQGKFPTIWALDSEASLAQTKGLVPLVVLPAGEFQMGSPENEDDRNPNETRHLVKLTRPFAIGRTEVTQGQYKTVMELTTLEQSETCDGVGLGDDLPVVCLSWLDAVEFANRLSERDGLDAVYTIEGDAVRWVDQDATGYRLPTEAEWEYAARAGTETVFVGSNDPAEVCEFANVRDETGAGEFGGSEETTFPCNDGYVWLSPVEARTNNAWGLYGFGGNVSEWVWDYWYGEYEKKSVSDPIGPATGVNRVIRGGSWGSYRRFARVADRYGYQPSLRYRDVGFRLARSCLPSALLPSDCFRDR